jgi:hypothetical protein
VPRLDQERIAEFGRRGTAWQAVVADANASAPYGSSFGRWM